MPGRFTGALPPQVRASRPANPPQVGAVPTEDEERGLPEEVEEVEGEVQAGVEADADATTEPAEATESSEPDPNESGDESGDESESSTDVQPLYSEEQLAEMTALYEDMTVEELKDEAKGRDLSGYSQLNKAGLVELLSANDQEQTVAPEGDTK